jgi:hypothetical protein
MRRWTRSCAVAVILTGMSLGMLAGCSSASWMRVPARVVTSTPYAAVLEDPSGQRVVLAAADVKVEGTEVFVRQGGRLPRERTARGLGEPEPPSPAPPPPPTTSASAPSGGAWGCAVFIKFSCGSNEIIGLCSHSVACPQR